MCLFTWCQFITVNAQVADSTKVHTLSEVDVTASKRMPITQSSNPLQVIYQSDMERLGLQDLADAVKLFSGVAVKDYGGIGGLKTVSIRSLGAQHTAVSYDGVVVSNYQSGQVDISRFSLNQISNVSLSVGQSDNIFQTAKMLASAGALEIRTAKPSFTRNKNYTAQAQIRGGSFGQFSPSIQAAYRLSKVLSVNATTEWMQADGNYSFTLSDGMESFRKKRKNSDIKSLRSELNLFADWKQGSKMNIKAYYYDSKRGLPGSVILYNDYAKERLSDKVFFTQAYYENKFSSQWALKANLKYNRAYNKYVDVNNKYEGGKQVDTYTQQEYYASTVALYQPLSYLSFSLAEDFSYNTLRTSIPSNQSPNRYTSLSALAAQFTCNRLSVSGSILGTYITERVKTGTKADDLKRLSPAVSLSFQPFVKEQFFIRAGYKDVFRTPTFNDLYYPRLGNTGLKPEKAKQYNVGLSWLGQPFKQVSYIRASVDAYYNKVNDKIVAIPTMFIWKMMNFGKVEIKGVDINLATEIPIAQDMSLQLGGGYTYQHAIDITDKESKIYRNQIPYTPPHSGSASASLENKWVNISYSLIASSKRYSLPQNISDNKIDGYIEHTISANRSFELKHCNVRLQAEVVNLTNKTYEVIQWYPMPGRSFRALIRIDL